MKNKLLFFPRNILTFGTSANVCCTHSHFVVPQMTLGSATSYGYTVVDVVSIVGFVMEKREGTALDVYSVIAVYFIY